MEYISQVTSSLAIATDSGMSTVVGTVAGTMAGTAMSAEVIEESTLDSGLANLLRKIEETHSDPGENLYCSQCGVAVTTSKERTQINENHQFEVVNPAGINFNLACFRNAWGCGIYGEPESLQSWFSGYTWQYAYCLNCQEHLGWFYQSVALTSTSSFFGLIAEKLVTRSDLH